MDLIPNRVFPDETDEGRGNGLLRLVVQRVLETRRRPEAAVGAPSSPQERLLRSFWDCIARIEELTQRVRGIEGRIGHLRHDLQDLDGHFQNFARHRGRRVGYASLCLLSIPLSLLLDFFLLSAPVEAFLASLALPSGWPARLLAALGVSGILYILGSKYAVARSNGEPAWVLTLVAGAIAAAVGIAAFVTAQAAGLPGLLPKGLGLLGMAGPAFAFIAGAGIPEALDYLKYIRQHQSLSREMRSLDQARLRLGADSMRQFVELRRIQEEYRRQFGEELVPELSPEAQRLFNEYARTAPGPRMVLQTVEAPETARPAARRDGRPNGGNEEGPTVLVQDDHPGSDETEYLRQVLRRQALADDAALRLDVREEPNIRNEEV
jgi:hypothetical protein